MKILVIRLSSIGDIVLTSPVVRVLKKQLNAEVHFLTKKTFANWLCHNPYIDAIHHYEDGTAPLESEMFDFVVDLHHNLRTLKVKRALKLPSKSVNKLNIRKFILTTFKLNLMPPIHMVDRNIATVEHLGVKNDMLGLDFFIPESASLAEKFQLKKPFVAVVIGGQHATKILLQKINHNFSNKDVIEPLLSKYITEYIELSMQWGGLEYRKKGKLNVLIQNEEITPKKNSSTMKRRVKVLQEFKEFCDKKKLIIKEK